MKKNGKNILLISFALLSYSCKSQKTMLPTVKELDLAQYAGTWYEIARLPNSFERDLTSVTATYSLKDNGKVKVLNQGYKKGKKQKSITGTAWVPKQDYPGRLKVRFFWPFAGDYYVLNLDHEYKYALVGSPSRKFLWILSKEIDMPEKVYQAYIENAAALGFQTNELILVDQGLNMSNKN